MKKASIASAAFLVAFICTKPADASIILDQLNEPSENNKGEVSSTNDFNEWQQQVVAGTGGTLKRIEFFTKQNALGNISFYVNKGTGWQNDTHDFSSSVDVVANTVGSLTLGSTILDVVSVDVSAAAISLNSGDSFVLGFKGQGLGTGLDTNVQSTGLNQYAGSLYLSGNLYNEPAVDLGFRTYMDDGTNPVPEPANIAVWLIIGLCGLGYGVRFKMRKSAEAFGRPQASSPI